jgi:hypothetical protein
MQKAIRRGDLKIAGFFGLDLYFKYPEYVWKRLLIISAEDCFGIITKEIKALYDSWDLINKKKKNLDQTSVFVSKAIVLLCSTAKCRDSDHVICLTYKRKFNITDEEIKTQLEEIRKTTPCIPKYAIDCHTSEGKRRGMTKEKFLADEFIALENRVTGQMDGTIELFMSA